MISSRQKCNSQKPEAHKSKHDIVSDFESFVRPNQLLEVFANCNHPADVFLQLLQPVHPEGEEKFHGSESSTKRSSKMTEIGDHAVIVVLQVPGTITLVTFFNRFHSTTYSGSMTNGSVNVAASLTHKQVQSKAIVASLFGFTLIELA